MSEDAPARESTLLFVRHGAYEGTATDETAPEERITERGETQMEVVADSLSSRDVDALYCSDMPRALQSARIVRDGVDCVDGFEVDETLREHVFPVAESLRSPEIEDLRAQEELSDDRLAEEIDRLWATYFQPDAGERLDVFVAHGNLIRVLAVRALGVSTTQWPALSVCHNASITEFALSDDRESLVAYNDRHALPPDLRTR